jgi:hypothetical protein
MCFANGPANEANALTSSDCWMRTRAGPSRWSDPATRPRVMRLSGLLGESQFGGVSSGGSVLAYRDGAIGLVRSVEVDFEVPRVGRELTFFDGAPQPDYSSTGPPGHRALVSSLSLIARTAISFTAVTFVVSRNSINRRKICSFSLSSLHCKILDIAYVEPTSVVTLSVSDMRMARWAMLGRHEHGRDSAPSTIRTLPESIAKRNTSPMPHTT